MSWLDLAACLGSGDEFVLPLTERQLATARATCAGCPVTSECLADGEGDDWSVRAGLTPDERKRLVRVRTC